MRPITVYLDAKDIEELKKQAKELVLPPHTLARAILVRGLRKESNSQGKEGGILK